MKKVMCAICLVLVIGACDSDEPETHHNSKKKPSAINQIKTPPKLQAGFDEAKKKLRARLKEIDEEYSEMSKKPDPVFDVMKMEGTPQEKLSQLRKAAKKGQQWVIEIRKPAVNALEDLRKKGFLSEALIPVMGINEKYIRTGPGMEYDNDDTGPLLETELLYVLEEKNGWIRFRITKANLGWSAWIQKDLTTKP